MHAVCTLLHRESIVAIVNGVYQDLGSISDNELIELLVLDLVALPARCMCCGKASTDVDVLNVLLSGDSSSAREMIISGTHSACWDAMFSDED